MSVRKLLIAATCLYQGKKKRRGSKSTRQWGLLFVSMLKWALTLAHSVMKSPGVPQVLRSVIKSHTCMKWPHFASGTRKMIAGETPFSKSQKGSHRCREWMSSYMSIHNGMGGLEEKQLQKEKLKDIDWRYKKNFIFYEKPERTKALPSNS